MNEDLKEAKQVLYDGGVILYPTDTIWGLGCDATNPDAVKKIYDIKKRCDSKSMLVLMENQARLNSYVDIIPEIAWDLIETADKPMTIIYPGAKNLAPSLIAEDGSIGIRFTSEEFTSKLIQRYKKPIVSTSANISGEDSPKNFSEISQEIIDAVDYVVKYRQDEIQETSSSSIIKLGVGGEIEIIRP